MKKTLAILLALLLLAGCAPQAEAPADGPVIAATTAPMYQFTKAICEGTELNVQCVITESVSCLHDYTLSVGQMQLLEQADAIVISGMGLEDFMTDVLKGNVIDASQGVEDLIPGDPHYWLDPGCAEDAAETVCRALCALYPQRKTVFERNLEKLENRFDTLDGYAEHRLERLRAPGLVTFHDGFAYFADFADIPLLAAMEIESGSEPAAKDLMDIIDLVNTRRLPAVFTEVNGSESAAAIVSSETGCQFYPLDMAMQNDYFIAMEHNIDTLWEAFS